MPARLVGYFPKRLVTRAGWAWPWPEYPDQGFPAGPEVDEICSVSRCIARGLDFWAGDVPFNEFGGFASPDEAAEAIEAAGSIEPGPVEEFALYAYRLFDVRFVDGLRRPLEVPELAVAPMPESYVRLGLDAVVFEDGSTWGCSPLSCNGQAGLVPSGVNRHCLIDAEPAAMAVARGFSETKPEPGPYVVVEVWRDLSRP